MTTILKRLSNKSIAHAQPNQLNVRPSYGGEGLVSFYAGAQHARHACSITSWIVAAVH